MVVSSLAIETNQGTVQMLINDEQTFEVIEASSKKATFSLNSKLELKGNTFKLIIMKALIETAVSKMKCIEFMYDGYPRIVEPHCFGISAKGYYVLRGFQVGGSSSSGKLGWRLFELDKIDQLIVLDEYFQNTRPDYRRGDKNMSRIIIEL